MGEVRGSSGNKKRRAKALLFIKIKKSQYY